jgi:hypothetical protein
LFRSHQNKLCIAIKTSAGEFLGTGHLQRMCSLLWYLNEYKNIRAFLVSDIIYNSIPDALKKYYKTDIDFSPDIIIRDMRDSSEDEIVFLKRTAPVLAIDDNGPGRKAADNAIDILPNPEAEKKEFNSRIFIYGYNFLKALQGLKNKKINKDLDFVLYPGNSAGPDYIDLFASLLPEKSDYAVLQGDNSFVIKNGNKKNSMESSYAETILSSKAVISHFGITLYEGSLAGCKIIAINPSEYHSKLTDMAGDYLNAINLGVDANLKITDAKIIIKKAVQSPLCSAVKAADVYRKVIDGLENFCSLLFGITGSK